MNLKDLLYKVPLLETLGSTDLIVKEVHFDSRKVSEQTLFVALKGTVADGHNYINKAIALGATAIVCENLPQQTKPNITYVKVKNTAKALGILCSNFYNNPSSKLKLVAITGTNGKTTTATLLYNLFSLLGKTAGLLSTVNVKIGSKTLPATHTTPDPLYLNQCLAKMVEAGVEYCFMEASSHGIHQERMAGLALQGAVFTNLSHDHLDYHKTFNNYIAAKKKLFDDLPANAFALVNTDDKNGSVMIQNTKAKTHSYALKTDADFKAKILEHQLTGMLVKMDNNEIWTKLIGNFNAYNLLAIYSVAQLLEQDDLEIATAISQLNSVSGRFEYIQSEFGITAIVDYAHTPDALSNVLGTISQIRTGNELVISVVGCGGNRDAAKRPLMGKIATEMSDQVIFTSDNPRDEDPEEIISQMEGGVEIQNRRKYLSISNRKEAIKTAVKLAQKGDIILIAGKGHEKYQEIKGERFDFDDFAIANELLNQHTQ